MQSELLNPETESQPINDDPIDLILSVENADPQQSIGKQQKGDNDVDVCQKDIGIAGPPVSNKALTRSALIAKCRDLYKISGQYPVIDGTLLKNFARLRKSQLLLVIQFYCDQIQASPLPEIHHDHFTAPQQESTPMGNPVHENFVSSVLFQGNCMLLSAFESFSKSQRFQNMTGLTFPGVVEHVQSNLTVQSQLKECLFELYQEHSELLDAIISPTSKLVFLNMSICFACCKSATATKNLPKKQPCSDKTHSSVLRV